MANLENKRICLVVTSLQSGGLERNAVILANHFNSCKAKVSICCLYSTKCFFDLDKGIELIDMSTSKNKLLSIGSWIKRLKKYFKENNVETVISFGDRVGFVVSSAIKSLNINHICRGVNSKKNLINKILLNIAANNINTFVFQTNAQKSLYSKKLQSKGVVIPNPFTIYDKNLNANGVNSKRFVVVASFKLKQKRQDIIIKAFALFAQKHSDYTLELYGRYDNDSFNKISSLIEEEHLEKQVFIKGECDNIKDAIIPSRAFICASTYEGMPNALIESLSYGIPVISSDWLGHNEILSNDVNSLLFRTNNIQELANCMEQIVDDNVFNRLSNNAYKTTISSLDEKEVLNRWDEII